MPFPALSQLSPSKEESQETVHKNLSNVSSSPSELADLIKETHKSLRENTKGRKDEEVETVWNEHAGNISSLQKYAEAMHILATKHWDNTNNVSRIRWIHDSVSDYFYKGGVEARAEKERRKVSIINNEELPTFDNIRETLETYDQSRPLLTLDVGSCYNPFEQFKNLNVTPIDLHPAKSDVFECDFLKLKILNSESDCGEERFSEDENVKSNKRQLFQPSEHQQKNKRLKSIGSSNVSEGRVITELECSSFDIVIFCLFLEYIPCPRLRHKCCEKAYNLLKPNGLLCIVTPDSKHSAANSHLFTMWKITLSHMGFNRIKYEKCPHFHGMLFRKGIVPSVWREDCSRELQAIKSKKLNKRFNKINYNQILNSIYIVQDIQDLRDSEKE